MPESDSDSGREEAYVAATFQALADAILPPVWKRTAADVTFIPGGVQRCADQYVRFELDRSQFIPANGEGERMPRLSWASAKLLDAAADELIRRGAAPSASAPQHFPGGGSFAALTRIDRLQALALIDRSELPLHRLPPPFADNAVSILVMANSFFQLTMFGYYSEWPGYGSTRLSPRKERRLECFPPGWSLTGYPGPSSGYRDLRGFEIDAPLPKGGAPNG
jgi:hypothetical protein